MKTAIKKCFFIIFTVFFFNSHSQAQVIHPLKFDKQHHDFGVVKEETQKISYIFNFKNISNDTVLISNVSTSCGCTAGEWKKTPLIPGEDGIIVINYKTAQRPGRFSQPVIVHLNNNDSNKITLTISGEVLPREKTKLDIYPIPIGNLRFITTHLPFNEIYNDSVSEDTLFMYNDWDKLMTIAILDAPDFIKYEVVPKVLKPHEDGLLIIEYDASKRKDWGLIFDKLNLVTNDSLEKIKTFHISAEIIENFSKLNLDDLKKAPNMIFENTTINFDTITEGDVIINTFNFTNTGYSDLIIRKISTSCWCTASNTASDTIKSGINSNINVKFSSDKKKGNQRHTITVITNNPHKPTVKLVLQGYVKPKNQLEK